MPNTELGHLQIRGKDAEHRAAASIKERKGLSWHAWSKLLAEYLDAIDALIWPDLVIIGGGISKHADRFIHDLPVRVALRARDAPEPRRHRRRRHAGRRGGAR